MRALALAADLAAACGAHGEPASEPHPLGNHAGPATPQELAVAKLHELAAAIRADGPIARLADPQDGIWLWEQPGVAPRPAVHADAGDGRALTQVLASGGIEGGRATGWIAGTADAIDHGLAALDVDGDPIAPEHNVDCGADPMKLATRAVLRTKAVDLHKDFPDLDGSPVEKLTTPLAFRFDFNQVTVYLSMRNGAIYVAHLVVSTPCEA